MSESRRNALLAVASVAVTVAAAELALRIARVGLFARPSSAAGRLRLADGRSRYPAEYDALLGYVSAPR